jgi:hypothetical protein
MQPLVVVVVVVCLKVGTVRSHHGSGFNVKRQNTELVLRLILRDSTAGVARFKHPMASSDRLSSQCTDQIVHACSLRVRKRNTQRLLSLARETEKEK